MINFNTIKCSSNYSIFATELFIDNSWNGDFFS